MEVIPELVKGRATGIPNSQLSSFLLDVISSAMYK